MKWVDEALTRPNRCAVVPFIGNGSGHQFLDTGQDLDREHVYISDAGAEEIATMLGWVPPHQLQATQESLVRAYARVEELEREVKEYEELDAAIAGLTKRDWQIRKPQGRKPQKEPA